MQQDEIRTEHRRLLNIMRTTCQATEGTAEHIDWKVAVSQYLALQKTCPHPLSAIKPPVDEDGFSYCSDCGSIQF